MKKKVNFIIFLSVFFNFIFSSSAKTLSKNINESLDVKEELTEEKLREIIEISKNSPDPESNVNIDKKTQIKQIFTSTENLETSNDRLYLEENYSALVKKYYDFLDELNEEIKDHQFKDKTKVVPLNNEISKELTSNNLIKNFELGIGMKYQGVKEETYHFDQEQSNRSYINSSLAEENNFGSIPIYATGKYNFSTDSNNVQPYLKLNLGYYIEGVENREKEISKSGYVSFNESMEYSNGRYYGFGGGVEYSNGLTFDVMYQINKNKNNENSTKDDRVTFSVEYKLDL